MKRQGILVLLILIMAVLAACSGRDNGAVQSGASPREVGPDGAQAETAVDEALPVTSTDVAATVEGQAETGGAAQGNAAAPVEPAAVSPDAERPVDLDLTRLSGTVVYSQVYDMMAEPESYMGQMIKMKGSFSYYRDPDTKQEYFAAVIADATACCAQGIEFVWRGEHSYPRDYPPLDTDITVTGTFGTYYEGDSMYVRLADAQVEWDA